MANNVINSLTIGDNTGIFTIPYAICSTAGSTSQKEAELINGGKFVLQKGARVAVTFKEQNTASAMTLNVQSTGEKSVTYGSGGYAAAAGNIKKDGTYEFLYDGEAYQLLGGVDTNTIYNFANGFKTSTGNVVSINMKSNTKAEIYASYSSPTRPELFRALQQDVGGFLAVAMPEFTSVSSSVGFSIPQNCIMFITASGGNKQLGSFKIAPVEGSPVNSTIGSNCAIIISNETYLEAWYRSTSGAFSYFTMNNTASGGNIIYFTNPCKYKIL